MIDRCGWLAAITGRKTTSDDVGVNFDPDAWSDPAHVESAHVELTPMPMVNNATASVRLAMTKAFAKAV